MKIVSVLVLASILGAVIAILFASYSYFQNGVSVQGSASDDLLGTDLPIRFENATNLTNNERDSVYGQVVAANEHAYLVWQESVPSLQGNDEGYTLRNYDVFLKKSSDKGETFGEPINLSNNPGFSEHPQAAAYNGSFYSVWADDSSGNREVLFTRSPDNATTFEATVNLSNNTSDSFNQEMAASGNGVYVVWLDENDSGGRVLLRASADGGETFGRTVVISDKANSASFPKVAADGDSVHVTWNTINDEVESGLFYVKSDDNGKTFSSIMKLNRYDNFGEPQIAVKDRVVYVVSGGLQVLEVPNLFYAKSVDGGATFLDGEIEGNGTFVNPLNVELIPDGSSSGLLYVVGQVFVSGNEEIILMPLSGGTEVLPKPAGAINLSKNPRISECPSIAIAGDNIYVVWEDLSPGNHEILYARGFKG